VPSLIRSSAPGDDTTENTEEYRVKTEDEHAELNFKTFSVRSVVNFGSLYIPLIDKEQ
jgi:hypothetical protein